MRRSYKPAVVLTGASEEVRQGPVDPVTVTVYGPIHIIEVTLPCALQNIGEIRCCIKTDGNVVVEGFVASGEVFKKSSPTVINKRIRQISPRAPFSISFSVPGALEANYITKITADGKFKAIVLKEA